MSDAKKVQCSKCERMIDPRGLRAHEQTHGKPANVRKIAASKMRKKEPVSIDVSSFRLGFRLGREIGQEVA
jgi:hypothetical protein